MNNKPVLDPLHQLLLSKRAIVSVIWILGQILIYAIPQLSTVQINRFSDVLAFAALTLVGGFTLENITTAIKGKPIDLETAVRSIVDALFTTEEPAPTDNTESKPSTEPVLGVVQTSGNTPVN